MSPSGSNRQTRGTGTSGQLLLPAGLTQQVRRLEHRRLLVPLVPQEWQVVPAGRHAFVPLEWRTRPVISPIAAGGQAEPLARARLSGAATTHRGGPCGARQLPRRLLDYFCGSAVPAVLATRRWVSYMRTATTVAELALTAAAAQTAACRLTRSATTPPRTAPTA